MEHWPLNVPSNSSDSVVLWTAMVLSQLSPVTSASSPWLRIVGSVCHWAGDPRMFQLPCLSWVLKAHVFLECLSLLSQPHHCTQWFYISLCAEWFTRLWYWHLTAYLPFLFTAACSPREKLQILLKESWSNSCLCCDPMGMWWSPRMCSYPYQEVLALSF